jgi:hypothetical protein
MSRRHTVLVDVDGTVALMGDAATGRRRFDDWHRVGEDDPNQPVIDLVRELRGAGYGVVFISGRDEVCRDATMKWLIGNGVAEPDDELYLRRHLDDRSDFIVKLEIYEQLIQPHRQVAWVFEDRDQVVRMWRAIGLTVLQVAPGDF